LDDGPNTGRMPIESNRPNYVSQKIQNMRNGMSNGPFMLKMFLIVSCMMLVMLINKARATQTNQCIAAHKLISK
jgi:hypothetical protein